MNWETIVTPVFYSRLCVSLLHSFWLIALLAVAARAADYLLRRRSVEVRYAVYVTAVIGCFVTLPLTFAMVEVSAAAPAPRLFDQNGQAFQDANADEPGLALPRGATGNQFRSRSPRTASPQAVVSLSTPDGTTDSERASIAWVPGWYRWSPWILGLYVFGVFAMLARLVRGVWTANRLRVRAETIHEGPLVDLLSTIATGWSMRVVPTLARAQAIVVPKVVGLVRPTVLLPMSATTGLSIDQLAMILAHELAHVRRYDMWVNLLQRLTETVLFFNPAVWYISRHISTLREYCCDEMVCEAMARTRPQPQASYASALLRVAELGSENNSPQTTAGERSELAALAASGHSPSELRRRVAHLFGEPLREPLRISKGSLLTLAILALLLVISPASWRLEAETETTLSAEGVKNASENDFGAVTDALSENAQLYPKSERVESPIRSVAQDDQILRFPEDHAVGVVYSRPAKDGGFGFRDDWYGNWRQVARARGKVSLPVGHHIRLDVAKAASRDLTFLDSLDPESVEALFLEGTDVNDEQLKHIGQLTGLRFLDLSLTRITDRGFQHLANLRKLQRLDLSAFSVDRLGYGVGDAAMAVVAKLPDLETINLRLTKVTDRGMALLAECTSLRSISLSGTSVTDLGLEHLKRLPNLESLRLGVYDEGAKITDKGLKVVGEKIGLRYLGLSGTKVSDAGLRHLKNLDSLSIDEARVTKADAAKTAADLFPASTIAYAELSRPAEFLNLILDHPLRQRVEKLDQVRQLLENPQYAQFQAIVKLIEQQIGMKWDEALGAVSEGGIHIGFDPKSEGLAVLVRAKDQATLEKLRDTFLKLARDEAQRQGNKDPIKTVEYRGITAYSADQAKFATVGPWLVLVNNDELGKAVLDNYLDGNKNSLSSNKQFQASRKLINGKSTVWAFMDVAAFRAANADSALYKKKTDNVLVELLIGGMLGTFQNTPYVVSTLDITKQGVAFKTAAPHDPDWVGEEREYFFGPGGKGAAPPLLRPKQTIFSMSTYRDFSGMWLRSADIFEDNVDAAFAQANGTLSTFFSGKDFGEDILGSFKPEVQIVAARQQFEEKSPIPAIKIPAFAFIFQFKEPEKMRVEFRRTFLSLIGFLNVIGAMNGQPQLDLDFEKIGDSQIITSTYAPEADEKNSKQAKINFNFSPSVGFGGEYFIVSSTKQFARELVKLAEKPNLTTGGKAKAITTNTEIDTNFSVIRDALEDNRKQLVAQNILSEGRDKAEAEKQIGILLEALGLLRNFSLKLATSNNTVQFEMELNLAK